MKREREASGPNVILINCDDLGYGDLGCCGSTENSTPFLDSMAAEGVRFTDFYMASPVCSPSRGAMMTGCYPPRIGFGSFDGRGVLFPGSAEGLNPEEETIAGRLKKAGYATRIVGKWHCGDQPEFLPTRHGFDGYYGIPYSNDMGIQKGTEDRGFPPLPLLLDEEVLQSQPDQASVTERYVEDAVKFIRKKRNRPFFLYFAHMYVHLPIYAPERFIKESENGRYGAAVACIDWAAGVLMAELESLGIDENTLIIFTSDNGSRNRCEGGSNKPLRGTKGTTWEGGQRVPCLMRWPSKIKPGGVCGELATAMDFYPTLANISGAGIPGDRVIDGKDISGLILNDGEKTPHKAFFYYRGDSLEAVRSGKWKLHARKGKEKIKELYNLKDDIGEENNLYGRHPDAVSELEALMRVCRQDLGDEAEGVKGSGNRPAGRVESPQTLTRFDSRHPYIVAMYDLEDIG